MESLKGFIHRHRGLTKEAFLEVYPFPFLASTAPKDGPPPEVDHLFPGAWVIPIRKRRDSALSTTISVGREQDQDVRIDDPSVSKEHCYFKQDPDLTYVADANSTNGTYVNGHPLAPHVLLALRSGDRLGIGEKIVFHFFLPEHLFETLFGKRTRNAP